MKISTIILCLAFSALVTAMSIWRLIAPEQHDLRMPLWIVGAFLIGALADRFLSKRY